LKHSQVNSKSQTSPKNLFTKSSIHLLYSHKLFIFLQFQEINDSQRKKIEELENLIAHLQLENNRLKKELEDIKSAPPPEPPKPQTVLVGTAGGWQSPLPHEVLIALQEYVLTK
jgi:hypothetical protein